MKRPLCEICSQPLHRNGTTRKGSTRWRCRKCGSSLTRHYDPKPRQLKAFLDYLTGSKTLAELPGEGRTFQRNTAWCWKLWPQSPFIDETYPVVFVDGIHLGRKAVMLIAANSTHVLGWYLARTENTQAYRQLLAKIRAPLFVVSDGGSGFASALRSEWPNTIHQRCLFHVFGSVKRCTTMSPKTQAGKELYVLAKALLKVKTPQNRDQWEKLFWQWDNSYRKFLSERSVHANGRYEYTHRRLRRARRVLRDLLRDGLLFRFLDEYPRVFPAYTNQVESVNARLRDMLHKHRGYSLLKRAKAIMWWCYLHSPTPVGYREMVELFPTDDQVVEFYQHPRFMNEVLPGGPEYGQVVLWHEIHRGDPYRIDWD